MFRLVATRDEARNLRPILGIALLSLGSGFGQFSIVAALGGVAQAYAHHHVGKLTFAEQAGLSGTKLGVGLAIIRFASLGAIVISQRADRLGRRRIVLIAAAIGLALTVVAPFSPSFWIFVAIFAAGRPLLSSVNALTLIMAAEQSAGEIRAKAMALVSAAYALGAGISAVIHALAPNLAGFRGVFLLAVVPLLALVPISRMLQESPQFASGGNPAPSGQNEQPTPHGRFKGGLLRRLLVVMTLFFAISVVTGPANSFVFLYAENIKHLPGAITALMIVVAGIFGFFGLLLGRFLADHLGRRPTIAIAIFAMVATGTLTYSGSRAALLIGYVFGIVSGALFAPAGGAMLAELFPTPVRALAAGWQVVAGVLGAVAGLLIFGAIAGTDHRFALAAVVTFLPVAAATALLLRLPETLGHELDEDLA